MKRSVRPFLQSVILLFPINLSMAQNAGESLFNDSFLHEIRFTYVDTNQYINTKDYQCVNMTIDGTQMDSIGIKKKGNISFYTTTHKYPIKVKTNKYVAGRKYDDIKEFTLHMNFQDPSMLREKLTYDLCTSLGLYSLRTAFAKVYIDEVYWGLFTLVEGKDEMFKQVFDHRDMDAIESIDFGDMCYISENPDDYNFEKNGWRPTYYLENGNELTAWARFAKMIDKSNNTDAAIYLDTVSKYLNLGDFYKLMAINVVLMNFDSYIGFRGNQIYAFDTIQNIWQVIPWDFNASFGLWNTNNYSPSEYSILPAEVTEGCIAMQLNNNSTLYSYYMDALCQLNTIICDTLSYFAKIESFKSQIKSAVYDDRRKVISNPDFDKATEYGYQSLFNENIPALKTFIHERIKVLNQELGDLSYICSTTSINESAQTYEDIILYPNPANNTIHIKKMNQDIKIARIVVVNALGQNVLESCNPADQLNVSCLNGGVYTLLAYGNDKNFVFKFIKK